MNFLNRLKQYNLSSILEFSSEYSNRLWKKEEPVAEIIRFEVHPLIAGIATPKNKSFILPWSLADISYYAILHTNDFKHRKIDEHEFIELYGSYQNYETDITLNNIENLNENSESKFFYILFGLAQKSFWYQEKYTMLKIFTRFYRILVKHSDKIIYEQLNKIILKEMNCSLDTLFKTCLFLYLQTSNSIKIKLPITIDTSVNHFNINNSILFNILESMSSDYSTYRRSTLEAKEFHINPILKNLNNEYLILNAFLFAKKATSFPYWYLRDIYKKNEGKELNQLLGEYFEDYVDYLLGTYLSLGSYKRIKTEKNNKRADLRIDTKKYQIIIEQKFQVLNVSNKDTIFNLKNLDRSFSELKKAIIQLNFTANNLKLDKEQVLWVLTFDELHLANGLIKKRIEKSLKDIDISSTFFINIDEFEMMIQLLAKNEDKFNSIIELIKKRSLDSTNESIEYSQVLYNLDLYENNFIANEMKSIIKQDAV